MTEMFKPNIDSGGGLAVEPATEVPWSGGLQPDCLGYSYREEVALDGQHTTRLSHGYPRFVPVCNNIKATKNTCLSLGKDIKVSKHFIVKTHFLCIISYNNLRCTLIKTTLIL